MQEHIVQRLITDDVIHTANFLEYNSSHVLEDSTSLYIAQIGLYTVYVIAVFKFSKEVKLSRYSHACAKVRVRTALTHSSPLPLDEVSG
jgi:hypothetical protein